MDITIASRSSPSSCSLSVVALAALITVHFYVVSSATDIHELKRRENTDDDAPKEISARTTKIWRQFLACLRTD
jgi:hypothetical protein